MGKMSELDAQKQEIEALDYQMISDADVNLTAKHQHVSEIPTPQDVVKSRNGFDWSDAVNFSKAKKRSWSAAYC